MGQLTKLSRTHGCTHVDNLRLLPAHHLKVPLPHLGGDGLADRSQHAEVLHFVLDKLVASPLEQAERRGRHIELRHLVLVDYVPVAREVGIRRRAFEDNCRDAEQ